MRTRGHMLDRLVCGAQYPALRGPYKTHLPSNEEALPVRSNPTVDHVGKLVPAAWRHVGELDGGFLAGPGFARGLRIRGDVTDRDKETRKFPRGRASPQMYARPGHWRPPLHTTPAGTGFSGTGEGSTERRTCRGPCDTGGARCGACSTVLSGLGKDEWSFPKTPHRILRQ